MRVSYSFSVLRYVHDPVTQEFVNIGVALFAPDTRYLRVRCTTSYSRARHLFGEVDRRRFRQISRYIEEQVNEAGRRYQSGLEPERTIEQFLARVLPPDDSAFQFSQPGDGLSRDLDRTLDDLFERHVARYAAAGPAEHRSDDDVWRSFREPLDRAQVTPHLRPKRIVAPSFDYEFQRSWKNQIDHVYEPVSFDLSDATHILDKANRWVGRATSLADSPEPFKIHLLLGEPSDSRLKDAFHKAQNILHKMPGQPEFVRESDAESFAEDLARAIRQHPPGS